MAISKINFKSSPSATPETWMDLTTDTVTAATLMSPKTAHGADGEAITGTATEKVLGTKTITSNGTYNATSDNVDGFSSVVVNVSSGGGMSVVETPDAAGGTIVTITGEEIKLQSKTATPTTSSQTISPDATYTGLSQVLVQPIPSQYIIPTGTKSITQNGTGIDVAAYASVNVSVTAPGVELQAKTHIAPTESSQTITADTGYDGLSSVQIDAVSSTYVGTGITRRSSTDLTASGATVTVPAGYYATSATKDVATMTLPTASSASATSGFTSKATISRSTSDQYINIPTGYNTSGAYYKVNAVANGSATAPASISGSAATVSTGTNTLTLTKTVSVTPSVSAGYVSSGTAGNSSISLTANVTTKSAATITPTKSAQTILSGTYLTGTQTIAAIPAAYQDVTGVTAAAGDVVSGKTIVSSTGAVVNGSLVIQHYYTGSTAPSSSLGVNGDIYLQTS